MGLMMKARVAASSSSLSPFLVAEESQTRDATQPTTWRRARASASRDERNAWPMRETGREGLRERPETGEEK
jgi:hypothetical protein